MSKRATPLYRVFAGFDLSHTVFRLVDSCPPVLHDLTSYEALGRSYDRRDFFRGTGISVYPTREQAVRVGRAFGHGHAVAELDLGIRGVVWARTGKHGHLTVWAAPEILLKRVVQCESYER